MQPGHPYLTKDLDEQRSVQRRHLLALPERDEAQRMLINVGFHVPVDAAQAETAYRTQAKRVLDSLPDEVRKLIDERTEAVLIDQAHGAYNSIVRNDGPYYDDYEALKEEAKRLRPSAGGGEMIRWNVLRYVTPLVMAEWAAGEDRLPGLAPNTPPA